MSITPDFLPIYIMHEIMYSCCSGSGSSIEREVRSPLPIAADHQPIAAVGNRRRLACTARRTTEATRC
jgi:hypothetical protein